MLAVSILSSVRRLVLPLMKLRMVISMVIQLLLVEMKQKHLFVDHVCLPPPLLDLLLVVVGLQLQEGSLAAVKAELARHRWNLKRPPKPLSFPVFFVFL